MYIYLLLIWERSEVSRKNRKFVFETEYKYSDKIANFGKNLAKR